MNPYPNETTWADLAQDEQQYLLALSAGLPFQDGTARAALRYRKLISAAGEVTPGGWLILRGRP
jgi:hypothetical protein